MQVLKFTAFLSFSLTYKPNTGSRNWISGDGPSMMSWQTT